MIEQLSLWGDEFTIKPDETERTKGILDKIRKPKKVKILTDDEKLKSKNVSFEDKLKVVDENVRRILGSNSDNLIYICDKEEFHNYISAAIKNKIISIDTETLGTRTDIDKPGTDPFTCKLCGLCIYTPGQKSAYVPVNHIDFKTGERIENQLTEQDIKEELERLVESHTFNIFHNGKFDYMVLYYTCGVKVPITWDTMIGSQLSNENESASLKFQYKDKINPEQEKYDIDKLFNLDMLASYPIELFRLYAAQDALMTYQLYEYQKNEFEKPGCEKLYNLFLNIEMPVVTVTAEMEMRGVSLDRPLAKRMSDKFHARLDETDKLINEEMIKYKEIIEEWRKTPEANYQPIVGGKKQKSLSEKLSDPVELTSATQLGILLYDVLKVLRSKDGKKKVDEETLLTIDIPLSKLMLKKREYEKYLGTYIDKLPEVANPRDGRIHAHFNQMGREDRNVVTGRMSSSEPNLQNVPARGDIQSVRCMFIPNTFYNEVKSEDNNFIIPIEDEVLMADGTYQWSSYLKEGDLIEGNREVGFVKIDDTNVIIKLK